MFLLFIGTCALPFTMKAQTDTTKPTNQFEIAIKNASSLGLSNKQVQQIRKQNKVLRDTLSFLATHPDSTNTFNKWEFESAQLQRILPDSSYRNLLVVKSQSRITADAQRMWAEASAKNITAGYNKDSTIQQLITYLLAKKVATDQYRSNKMALDSAIRQLKANAPFAVRAIANQDANFGIDLSSQIGFAIKNKNALNTTRDQITQLISASKKEKELAATFKNTKDSTITFSKTAFESTQLKGILSMGQYDTLLVLYNTNRATNQANSDWALLTSKNLAGNFNQDSTISELKAYYIKRYSVVNKYADDPATKNKLLRVLNGMMPEAAVILKNIKTVGSTQASTGQFSW